jgi:SWI/SNF-related matrix-associated actin-dependent regulator 1 of chromatin subfamily A
MIKTSELNIDDDGNVIREYKAKKIVSRSKKIIEEAMSKSQLFQSHYDLVIIDEAHRLSNNSSNRFKIIADLLKRVNPRGIFELTGTMVTNSSKNLYNLLKLIDLQITHDWQYYMERYCGAKFYFKKNEKKAYTTMFLKEKKKESWYDLTYEEKTELDEILEKKCKKLCIQGKDANMEELQEIIKPYYLRRLKTDFAEMTTKTVKCIHYEMTNEEQKSYDELWDKYLELQEDKEKTEKNKKLIEVSLMRQWLADKMIPKTVELVKKCIAVGRKVVIFCAYDNEINKLLDEFGDICVYHNGKLNEKKKNDAVERFQNDDSIKVFIGNIFSAGVGLTLTKASVVVFNNFSFVPSDNLQCEDRIYRIGQDKSCTIYYQSFNGTYFDKMLEIVHSKEDVINKIIVTEKEK